MFNRFLYKKYDLNILYIVLFILFFYDIILTYIWINYIWLNDFNFVVNFDFSFYIFYSISVFLILFVLHWILYKNYSINSYIIRNINLSYYLFLLFKLFACFNNMYLIIDFYSK